MKTGKRTSGPASCQLRYSPLVHASVRGKLREVLSVHCPAEARNQGHAGRLLDSLCQEADAAGVSLLVTVAPFDGGADVKALGLMYSKRGFRAIQDDPLVMMR